MDFPLNILNQSIEYHIWGSSPHDFPMNATMSSPSKPFILPAR